MNKNTIIFGALAVVAISITGYLLYNISEKLNTLDQNLASSTLSLGTRVSRLEADLATTTRISEALSQKLVDQQMRTDSFQQSIGSLAGTVNTLEKLSKTDQELLQKYSKVYFLNENYVPIRLSNIDGRYLLNPDKITQFHSFALSFLTRMLDDASTTVNSPLLVVSAYRSFGTQSTLKSSYTVTYGSGANKFSADQGYSEHQLGTAVDLGVPGVDTALTTKFDTSAAYNWLTNNAYRYGFILSYPKNNSYYQYEPWHWRFVGVALATSLHFQNKNFYDLDQRTIDTYLANIFD